MISGTSLTPQLSQAQVSCIMPTADRRAFIPGAIAQFLRQDYENSELVILDDGAAEVGALVPQHDRIRYVREARKTNVGQKRNHLCELARGDIIVHWDDDDWSAPWRVRYQVEQLLQSHADVCGLDRVLFYEPAADQAWEYTYPKSAAPWVYGATLCYTRAFWRRNRFAPVSVGEDSRFVWSNVQKNVLALSEQRFFVGLVHAGNTSVKRTRGSRWRPYPAAELRELMAADCEQRPSAA
jgi:glycosyltransferase involved in cell wall biosynthesis